MRKIQILGAFIAVLAFSALAVASAGATLWLKNGASIIKEEASTTHGTIVLEKVGGAGNTKVECTGLFVGHVGGVKAEKFSSALDNVTLVENLTGTEKDLVKCKTLEGCFVAEPNVHAVHLPWTTELVLEGGATWDKQKGTGGEPGYEVECAFGIKVTCSGPEKAKFTGNGANGAEFSYLGAESGESTCTDGGKGFVKGTKGVALSFTVS